MGHRINQGRFLKHVNTGRERIKVLPNGRWWLTGFIAFQYGDTLKSAHRVHSSVICQLEKNQVSNYSTGYGFRVNIGLGKTMHSLKEKEKEKEKDNISIDITNTSNIKDTSSSKNTSHENPHPLPTTANPIVQQFDDARKLYPGTKRGLQVELQNFKKKHKKHWKHITPLLKPAIEKQIKARKQTSGFVPEWKHFRTWINQACWTEETRVQHQTPQQAKSEPQIYY